MDRKQEIIEFVNELNKTATKYNMKSKHIYRKLICSLMKYKEAIVDAEDLCKIKNIGSKTKEKILQKIFGVSNVSNENKIDSKKIDDGISKVSKTKVKNIDRSKSTKKYIPTFKSGAYAILKVLFKNDGLSKKMICHKGNKYSNTEFNLNSRISAWSAIKTLTKKDLVYKDEKKYFLSENGKKLSAELFYEESTILHENEVVLVIDSREMKSRRERSFFQSYFDDTCVQSITKNIELGDFIWICGDDVLNYIVERKKGSDFCSSITDGRMNNQKLRLKNSGIDNIYYIIEKLKESDMNRIGKNYVYAHLNRLKNENLVVIETDDIKETCNVIQMINTQIKAENNISNIIHEKTKKVSLDDYTNKGIKNADLLISDVFLMILCTVKGLKSSKARLILNKYQTYANFLTCSRNNNFVDEIANIEVDGQIIGKKLAEKIFDSLCN